MSRKDWQRSANGDWKAKRGQGDFLIWRSGGVWKARYRAYGSDKPVMLGFSYEVAKLKERCEKNYYWEA